jgi:hypothetical protein
VLALIAPEQRYAHGGAKIGVTLRAVAASHASSVRHASLSEARLRRTVQPLSGGIVAALFRKTDQRCAMEALPLRLNLSPLERECPLRHKIGQQRH